MMKMYMAGICVQVVKPRNELKVCLKDPRSKEAVKDVWRTEVIPATDKLGVLDACHL